MCPEFRVHIKIEKGLCKYTIDITQYNKLDKYFNYKIVSGDVVAKGLGIGSILFNWYNEQYGKE